MGYPSHYTEEDTERGLTELALAGGNRRLAARRLAARGQAIPADTIYRWAHDVHAERYQQLRERLLPRLQKRMAEEAEELVMRYADAEREAVDKFLEQKDDLQARDAAKAAQQFAIARGIATEKGLLLRGQPTHITEHRSGEDLLKDLQRSTGYDVDSDAEEIVDAVEASSVHALKPAATQKDAQAA